MNNNKVAFFTIFENGIAPNQRYRIEGFTNKEDVNFEYKYFPVLQAREVKVFYISGSLAAKIILASKIISRRFLHLFSLRNYHTVFVAREMVPFGTYLFEFLIKKVLRKRLVYDFDDAIWIKKVSAGNKKFSFLKSAGKYAKIMSLADTIIAGNNFLADYARMKNSHIEVIPSCVDLDIYKVAEKEKSENICIGWSGSESTLAHLLSIEAVLQEIQSRFKDRVYFKVISSRNDFQIEGINIKSVKWNAADEIKELSEFDIGIMPLFDDEWSKGKCSMKGIQYMGLGIPTIMTDIGTNKEVIQHGKNGLLANTYTSWIECLTELIESKSVRNKLGAAGRITIENNYSIQHWMQKWISSVNKQ